mgnify:CR=1 FL=1
MTWLLLGLIAINIGLLVFLIKGKGGKEERGEGLLLIQNQMSELHKAVHSNIKEIIEKVTRVDETGKQMVSFAGELRSLQDVLKNPKQRGVLGEYYLETILKNVLPPGSYQMQYAFPDGTIVDAAIFVKDKVIPIDSKFSLENYNRLAEEKEPLEKVRMEKLFENDLKQRIIETAKYIRPQDKTMDFAFMFIPHEAIYYDLVSGTVGATEENLVQRAASKYKVIAISPTSLFAYLQTVLQGLNALHIEEKAQDIVKRVEELGKHLKSYEEYYAKLGNTLTTTINHYNAGYKELGKVDKDILRITGEKAGFDTLTLEKPSVE